MNKTGNAKSSNWKQMIFLLICYIFVPLRQNSCKWKKAIVRNMAYID